MMKTRRLTAAAAVAALIGTVPAAAHAHNAAVHQNMTDYAYEALLAASLQSTHSKSQPHEVADALAALTNGDPAMVALFADAAKAIPKLRALPSGLHPIIPSCQKPAFAAANGGSLTPDWKIPAGQTLADVPMGMIRYPVNTNFGMPTLDCGITEDWLPGGALNGVNKGALTSRDHTGLVLGYWAQDVDNRTDDWVLRSSLGVSAQSPLASAGIAAGSSALIFSTCLLGCALFPPACPVCPVAAVVGPAMIIDKIQTTDFTNLESGDYVGFGHFVDVKNTPAGASLFDDKPGKLGERAGPNGMSDSTESLVTALFDATGMHINHQASDGPKNYEIILGQSGGPMSDFHGNTVSRTADEWESLTIGHTQLTSVYNLGMFDWQQFEGQLSSGSFQATTLVSGKDRTLAARHLGGPLHALGDASVPQHAAGTSGWGHRPYEEAMEHVYDELVGNPNASLDVLKLSLQRALVWRNFITAWRSAHPAVGNDIPVREMITALATSTFNKAMANQAQMFDPNVSLQFQLGDSDAANGHYETAAMKPLLRDLLTDGIAAELAFLLSTTEVMP